MDVFELEVLWLAGWAETDSLNLTDNYDLKAKIYALSKVLLFAGSWEAEVFLKPPAFYDEAVTRSGQADILLSSFQLLSDFDGNVGL